MPTPEELNLITKVQFDHPPIPKMLVPEKAKIISDELVERLFQVARDEKYLLLTYCLASHPQEWRFFEVYQNLLEMQGINSYSTTEERAAAERRLGGYSTIRQQCQNLPSDLFIIRAYKNDKQSYHTCEVKPEFAESLSSFCLALLHHSSENLCKNGLSLMQISGKHARKKDTPSRRWKLNKKIIKKLIKSDGYPYEDSDYSLEEFRESSDDAIYKGLFEQNESIGILTLQEAKFKLTNTSPETDEDIDHIGITSIGANFLRKTFLAMQIMERKYPEEYHSLQEISSILGTLDSRFLKSDPASQNNLEGRISQALLRWRERGFASGTASWAAVIFKYHRYSILIDFDNCIESFQSQDSDLLAEIKHLRNTLESDSPERNLIVINLLNAHARDSHYGQNNVYDPDENKIPESILLSSQSRKRLEDVIIELMRPGIIARELSSLLQIPIHLINQALHHLEDTCRIVFVRGDTDFGWQLSESELQRQRKTEVLQAIEERLTAIEQVQKRGGVVYTAEQADGRRITTLLIGNPVDYIQRTPPGMVDAWLVRGKFPISEFFYRNPWEECIFLFPHALRRHQKLSYQDRAEAQEDAYIYLERLKTILVNCFDIAIQNGIFEETKARIREVEQFIIDAKHDEEQFTTRYTQQTQRHEYEEDDYGDDYEN